jgi:hypothetical protein
MSPLVSISYTDPTTLITITHGCISDLGAYDPSPRHPIARALPAPRQHPAQPIPEQISCRTVTALTAIWLTAGKSNTGNWGEGRYTADQHVFWYYFGKCTAARGSGTTLKFRSQSFINKEYKRSMMPATWSGWSTGSGRHDLERSQPGSAVTVATSRATGPSSAHSCGLTR